MKVKKEILSVAVLGIRLVAGKTFGFARLADRAGDAFVSPPLMREVGEITPAHAIVEMAEKGRRVVRFLAEPEVRFVWEVERDEARMVALAPALALQWADRKEVEPTFIWSVSDTGNKEFQSLWSAAVGAGEAGKFLSRWEKEFFTPAKQREVAVRVGRLFEGWSATLPKLVEELAVKAYENARKGYVFDDEDASRYLVKWWQSYVPSEMQARVEALRQSCLVPVREARARGQEENKVKFLERKRTEDIWRDAELQRQLAGVRQGLTLAGIADLVDPEEVLKTWSSAGNYFATPDATSGELHALRWYRERREIKAIHLMDGACAKVGIETGRSWDEAPTWDPNYDNEAHGGDGMSGPGNYVGGGSRFKRYQWSEEAIGRIQTADKAAGFRADLDALVASELHRHMAVLDAETLGGSKLPWATEDKIFLLENKEKLRQIQAENARLKEEAKVEELRRRGLQEDEARLAAKSADEERRLLSIASVRTSWQTMLDWVPASRAYRGLHPDAKALLEEMRGMQGELLEQAHLEKQRRADEEARRVKAEKSGFLGKGIWDKLDGLDLK